ncbi:MAG: ATP-binding protein [Immundisolibacterales bacterium]|nr:ATP-binding protein [Immundisolibacterales bacterium]
MEHGKEQDRLDEELIARPDWWDDTSDIGLPPDRALGYLDLFRLQPEFAKRTRETLWSLRGRGGIMNWVRGMLVGLSTGAFILAWKFEGAGSPAWVMTGALSILAIANLIAMMCIWLKVIALGDWVMRLGAGDLEYRMRFHAKDVRQQLCVALDSLREESRRVVELRIVDRLSEGLKKRNHQIRETVQELERTQSRIVEQRRSAELGTLVEGIGKELNEPVSAMNELVESGTTLARAIRAELPEGRNVEELADEIEENIERIGRSARRAGEILNEMDTVKEPSSPRVHVDAAQLVREHATREAKRMGTPLTIGNEGHGSARLLAHRAPLEAVLTELVRNACEATARTDSPHVLVTVHSGAEEIAIVVEDNGTGMDEETARHATTPFFTTKPPNTGLGLGLTRAQAIANAHQGALEIRTARDEGTAVTLRLGTGR